MAEYVEAARFDTLPDDSGLVVELNGAEIALFRVGEEAYALENECPHREGPIGEGELEDGIVTCPFHAWQVDVRTGAVVYNEGLCAKRYPCKVENGIVYVLMES